MSLNWVWLEIQESGSHRLWSLFPFAKRPFYSQLNGLAKHGRDMFPRVRQNQLFHNATKSVFPQLVAPRLGFKGTPKDPSLVGGPSTYENPEHTRTPNWNSSSLAMPCCLRQTKLFASPKEGRQTSVSIWAARRLTREVSFCCASPAFWHQPAHPRFHVYQI